MSQYLSRHRRNLLACAIASLGLPAAAQITQLDPVVVTGNPLRSDDLAAPVSVLSGDALVLKRGSSLGDTLAGQPGVSSTYFGPNANRPVIRGLDGDRVRILGNAGASFDASSLSFDHAVPIDPLAIERIEVLRGPAALLYGGSAVGGVVNALDNRIPKAPLNGPTGAAELRLGGAERERSAAALLETGDGRWALHADAFGRQTADLRVPRFTPVEDGAALPESSRVRNSASRASGGAFGASFTTPTSYLGAAVDSYDSRYGIVAEPDVIIRMQREHLALAGEWRELGGPLRTVRAQLGRTVYEHREVEGTGEVGTTFSTRGTEARIEAEHAAIGGVRGVLGAQFERSDFAALGAEAFVPGTTTRKQGIFLLEETAWPLGTLSGGVRLEHARVDSAGDADPAAPQFGAPAQRSFSLRSVSLGNVWKFAPAWSLATTLSSTERAPTSFELYANGVHAATGAFERGDASLGAERGRNLDAALQWAAGHSSMRVGVFEARFSRFINLSATGATVDVVAEDGSVEAVPEYLFRPVRARLRGIEAQAKHRLDAGAWSFDLSGQLDLVRADDLSAGEPLPRIAPARVRIGLDAVTGPWTASVELDHAARQGRVAATDVATPGHSLLNLALSRRFALGGNDALAFVKLANATDALAYNASTIPTVRDLSPLPGRSLKLGLRVSF
ncbi:MAG TPA: TonB-dependent receptor [Piscinibacter sp.]|nr:TonB-dependent receptor [Piscinibacter sp.]